MGKASRTVEKQERQIEALQSQVGEINEAGRFTKAKVGTILRNTGIETVVLPPYYRLLLRDCVILIRSWEKG